MTKRISLQLSLSLALLAFAAAPVCSADSGIADSKLLISQNAPAAGAPSNPVAGSQPNQPTNIPTQTIAQPAAPSAASTVTTPDGLKPEPGLYAKPCTCQAQLPPGQQAPSKKKHKILKGLAKEFGTEMGDLGKDMFLAFSVQGNDPYEMPEHPDIPYIMAEAQFVDGSASNIYKYPDSSYRIQGGFLDGTFACQQADGLYILQYPNGARGTMKMTGNGAEVLRPDNTVTTMTRSGSGSYRVVNSKLGYMGDMSPDTTGLSYEFAKQNF